MNLSTFVIIIVIFGKKFLVQANGPRPSFQEQIGYLHSHAHGGDAAKSGQFPWAARIFCAVENTWFGGTLIHEQWVLTAATSLLRVRDVVVWLGGVQAYHSFQESGHVQMTSTVFVIHPDFFYSPPINNIAMIKLPHSVPLSDNIKPIALPTDDLSTEEGTATVVGYGKLINGSDSMVLRYSVVNLLPVEDCVSVCVKADVVNANETICSTMRSGAGPCGATHGSALIRRSTLLGFVSCFTNCDARVPSLYTKVNPYLDWINVTISPPPPSFDENESTTSTTAAIVDSGSHSDWLDDLQLYCDSLCIHCHSSLCYWFCGSKCNY